MAGLLTQRNSDIINVVFKILDFGEWGNLLHRQITNMHGAFGLTITITLYAKYH